MRHTIRFRITAIAVTLSAVLLAAVSLLVVLLLRAQLTDNLDEGLRQRANTIAAALVNVGPDNLAGDEDLLVQVVQPGGAIASSTNLAATRNPVTSVAARAVTNPSPATA